MAVFEQNDPFGSVEYNERAAMTINAFIRPCLDDRNQAVEQLTN